MVMLESQRPLQIFVRSPDALTLTRTSNQSQTLHQLKLSLLPRTYQSSNFYFTLNGRTLDDSTSITNSSIPHLSTLMLRCRVRGGGGDGGATGAESRDCYLNMYAEKKPDKVDPNEQRLSKWLNCALSYEPLTEPCVIDTLGNVFNKQALVEALIGKKLPNEFGHVKGLKDMVKIELCKIPGVDSGYGGARFQCPITGLEFNGKYKFFALRSCGHVLSVKAMKEVKSSSCLVCHEEFSESDKIPINGSEEEVEVLRARMEEEKMKIKKKKAGTKRGVDVKSSEKALPKVEANGKGQNGGVGAKGASKGPKRFKAVDMAPPNATKEVYASIFTSSRKSEFKETYSCRSLPLDVIMRWQSVWKYPIWMHTIPQCRSLLRFTFQPPPYKELKMMKRTKESSEENRPTSLASLPQEIIENILKRLSVKSLIRVACVCK